MATERKRIHFISLGCPKNRVDTEVMLGVANGAGCDLAASPEEAEYIVVNTCGFIGPAKEESVDTILAMGRMKEEGRCEKLVVAGCLSQRYPEELAKEMPEVDHFLGSSDMLKLGDVLAGGAERMLVGNPANYVLRASDPRVLSQGRHSAYLKIAEGCNRTCSFCAIPMIRGKQRSRGIDDIVEEAARLASQGVLELNLVSQDTIAYGRDREEKPNLAGLVRRLGDIDGLRWIRLHYLYPETLTDELVELIASHPKVVKYVDMPLQHASDAMLRRMKRGHGGARLRRVVETVRTKIPGVTFRTAFIVGHPGESDEDFTELVDFVKWAEFDRVGVFRYSDEEGTGAETQDAKVKPKDSAARHRKLMAVQRPIARKRNRALVGTRVEVLVDGASEEHEFVLQGRHAGQAPDIDGVVYLSGAEVSAGSMVMADISQSADYDLVGEVVMDEDALMPVKPRAKKRVSLRVTAD
ncbi:MAG: 30S ribosomal protein S12 methylthiotransferase RimO [Myxococcaceae bacterium]|nr:MAG: 30S ribosomal protein S12 methylthiotransferase RimO [Myxococcaceae bacterium]